MEKEASLEPGPDFVPMELTEPPDLGDCGVSGIRRVEIHTGGRVLDGVSFYVASDETFEGHEVIMTNGQIRQLLDFGRWKRVPRRLDRENKRGK